MYQRYKNINSNKIQRSNERVSQAFLTGGEDWLNVNRPGKNTLVLIKEWLITRVTSVTKAFNKFLSDSL